MSPQTSLLLDILRFAAALLVLAAHFTHTEFNTGLKERQVLGDIAVPIFFVLSGFVIRFVTRSRPHSIRDYFLDRASRMYSVILPAMALTVILSGVCFLIDPAYFMQHWGAFTDHAVSRVLLNLTFLSQSWGHATVPLIDSPFWSLSYECLFYIGYGLFFYLRGTRRLVSLALWAIVAGPQVLALLPVWALGCILYELYYHLRNTSASNSILGASGGYGIVAVSLFAMGHHRLLLEPVRLHQMLVSLPNPLIQMHLAPGRATWMAVATGILAAFTLLLLVLAIDRTPAARTTRLGRRFRPIADSTFSLYLMHYPLLVLAVCLGLLRPHHLLANLASAASIIVLLIFAAGPCNRLKLAIHSWLNMVVPQPRWFPLAALHTSSQQMAAPMRPVTAAELVLPQSPGCPISGSLIA